MGNFMEPYSFLDTVILGITTTTTAANPEEMSANSNECH